MTLEERATLYGAVDFPDNIGRVLVNWRDEDAAGVPVHRVREELFDLVGKVSSEIRWPDSVSISLEERAHEYPHLSAAAKTVLIMPASEMVSNMKRLAREYEQSGGKLLSEEEVRREIADRRGAA